MSETKKVTLKPFNPNYKIPNPQTGKAIPAEGCEVELTPFWARRLKDGDCIIVEDEKQDKISKKKEGNKSPKKKSLKSKEV